MQRRGAGRIVPGGMARYGLSLPGLTAACIILL